jgi:hypothetical protein
VLTNGVHKNNNDNTTPIFIGLNKTTRVSNIKTTTKMQNLTITRLINIYDTLQKTRTPQQENIAGKDIELCSQMYFSMNDENAVKG